MPRSTPFARLSLSAGTLALVAMLAAACATKPPAQDVKGGESAKPMKTAEDAEAVFDDAEKQLGDLLLTSDPAPQPPPAPESLPEPEPQAGQQSTTAARSYGADRCSRACRALASMKRAADRLCELTGEDDTRCRSVRARVDAARTVVRSACPDCSE